MKRKQFLFPWGLILLLLLPVTSANAQDDTVPASPPQDAEPQTSAPEEEKKPGFWGGFNLFIEAGYGTANMDDLNTSTTVGSTSYDVESTISFDGFTQGQAAVGWTLPFDRGAFTLEYNGYTEDGYTLTSTGNARQVRDDIATDEFLGAVPPSAVPWWHMTIQNGTLTASRTPAIWDPDTDDANSNEIPDLDEIRYPASTLDVTATAPSNLDNRFYTTDLTYGRGWGGRRYRGTWTAGLRYFSYEGNLISPAWVVRNPDIGYTSSALFDPIVSHAKTEGIGPTGSGGFVVQFFRERLKLYLEGKAAFLLQTMESNSGALTIMVENEEGVWYPGPGQLSADLDKNTWQLTAEIGLTLRIVEGLTWDLAYYLSSFHDAYLSPTEVSIPQNFPQIFPYPEGFEENVIGLYSTHDLKFDGARTSLRFQF